MEGRLGSVGLLAHKGLEEISWSATEKDFNAGSEMTCTFANEEYARPLC